ncbi:neprilysin-4-like [Sitophilus oryzae]|uniref:Neprilysin-4-like n=1 Tax=Sitophilus oryzae TaxID=7048 RepID=A0A6J2YJV2_SITOR|nr:neprilysin-4-like [Sitophilus oryzae]
MNFFTIISVICAALILKSNSKHMFRRYENTKTLDHEDHREILQDTKTVFLPEKIVHFRSYDLDNREKRKFNYNFLGPSNNYCVKANKINLGSFEILNDPEPIDLNISVINVPDVNKPTDDEHQTDEDKTVLVIKINITSKGDTELPNSKPVNDEIFWHNKKTKKEVRSMQSQIMQKYMNSIADPCNDFYSYACGNWKNYHIIPPDRSTYDTFEIIRENLDRVLNETLSSKSSISNDNASNKKIEFTDIFNSGADPNITTNATIKVKQFYESCMNTELILERGNEPLLKILKELDGWPILSSKWAEEGFDLFKLLGRLRLLNNDVILSQWIGPDIKRANQYIVHIDQTSLGLPTRDYFLDPKNIKYVSAYKILIVSTVKTLGSDLVDVEKEVDDIITFETMLAEIMASSEERRNISDVYLRTDLSSITLYFPQYDWKTYFTIILGNDISLDTPVAVYCAKYLLELIYLLNARYLDIKQRFNFVLYGREQQPPRWQFCVSEVNTHMGMALGALFVRKYFDETSKTDTIQMTQALVNSFKEILTENSWLDSSTKNYARKKIENMDLKIGFPDFVLNDTDLTMRYYDVEINPDYFFENVLSILRHLARAERKRLDTEVNRTLWSTSPAIVNAYYSRNKNQIMFPAGILQPPFYHKHFPKALNFGGIGVVIGHEITHGFDDKGRLFDQFGNLKMWWKDSSIRNFYEKAQCIIDQYSQYMLPEIKVALDGYMTQGENIADNGGLKQSFRAYQAWIKANPTEDETLPNMNLTNNQLFFLNFAQVWCGLQRIQEAKNRLKISVHSPGIFRIIGVLSNSEDFAKAYDCPKDCPMNPEKKCVLW